MSVILSVIIAIGAVLLGMFYPRRLSKYIDLDADAVDAVIVHYVLHGENEDGEFSETVYLDLDKIDLFVYYVKNIKVIPEYIAYKCKTSYYFDIYTNGKIYRFSSRSLTIWENGNRIKIVRFRIKDGNDGSLLILFGIKPNGD
ncbi:MAG: hypothetical protein K2I30_01780, partial [Clostridia bacterium]|nr:hypothetical protein [Clostridia bacterium]